MSPIVLRVMRAMTCVRPACGRARVAILMSTRCPARLPLAATIPLLQSSVRILRCAIRLGARSSVPIGDIGRRFDVGRTASPTCHSDESRPALAAPLQHDTSRFVTEAHMLFPIRGCGTFPRGAKDSATPSSGRLARGRVGRAMLSRLQMPSAKLLEQWSLCLRKLWRSSCTRLVAGTGSPAVRIPGLTASLAARRSVRRAARRSPGGSSRRSPQRRV